MNTIIIFIAQYLFIFSIIFAGIYWLVVPKNKKILIAKLALFSFPMAYIVAKLFSIFIKDPRPFMAEHIKPLISHIADNGFPSDHTLLTMAIASVIFVYNRSLGLVLAGLALAIGIARIAAGLHHPLDIAGSIAIAIGVTYIGTVILSSS